MKTAGRRLTVLVLAVFLAATSWGQSLVPQESVAEMEQRFSSFKSNTLKCDVTHLPATLGFDLRFQASYSVTLPFEDLAGKADNVLVLTRVTPAGKAPAVFAETYEIAAFHQDGRARLKDFELPLGGSIALGLGKYRIELLVLSGDNRACRREWGVKAETSSVEVLPFLALRPGSMAAGSAPLWDGSSHEAGARIRVTIMLNATPLRLDAEMLRAWDRTFLLSTLTTLLRQLPCSSVRVVAFNLEQRREIYRAEQFGAPDFWNLYQKLLHQDLGTVSVDSLRHNAAPTFLAGLVEREMSAEEPSDVVIWLGPNSPSYEKPKAERLPQPGSGGPKFVYVEYSPLPGIFPDSIHYLTQALRGEVFRVHSPADLGTSIQQLQKEIRTSPLSARKRLPEVQ